MPYKHIIPNIPFKCQSSRTRKEKDNNTFASLTSTTPHDTEKKKLREKEKQFREKEKQFEVCIYFIAYKPRE